MSKIGPVAPLCEQNASVISLVSYLLPRTSASVIRRNRRQDFARATIIDAYREPRWASLR